MSFALMNIYQFVSDEGEQIAIDAGALRVYCLVHRGTLKVHNFPVDPKLAKEFHEKDNSINPRRVWDLTDEERKEPLIYARYGGTDEIPDVMLVDGHHRYVRAAVDGWQTISAWLLTEAQWRPFQILNMPKITKEELAAIPPKTLIPNRKGG